MRVLWRRDRGTVEQVRRALPLEHRGAYTTVQTILNRLAVRGLLKREASGRAISYSANVTEADYLASSLHRTLTGASEEARLAALAALVGELDPSEFDAIRSLAQEIGRKREQKR